MLKSFSCLLFLLLNLLLQAQQISIGEITFEGNDLIPDSVLEAVVRSRSGYDFDQTILNEDAKAISRLYKQKGFWNVKVFQPQLITGQDRAIDIVFRIEENNNLLLEKINFSGNRYVSDSKLEAIIQQNIELPELSIILQTVLDYYNENGFLFAAVKLDSMAYKDEELTAFLAIEEGKFCEFQDYRFRGNKVTRENTLLKISGLHSEGMITPAILEKAADNLMRKSYIEQAEIIPLDHQQLLISIREDKMTLFSGILGYDNSQQNDEKLTGYINVEFLNLYGTDRNLTFLWQRLNAYRNSIELGYHESGPYNIPLSANLAIKRLEVDSTYIETSFETDVYYYTLRHKYGAYFALDDIFPGSRRPKLIEKTSYQKLGVFWEYSNLDYYLNPSRGNELSLRYYYIFHKLKNNNISKQAVEGHWSWFKKIINRVVFTTSFNAKVIENKELTELEYFELGGSRNLRGFTEDQFFGYRVGWINNELRYLLSRTSRFFIFIDYGYIQSAEFRRDNLLGLGFGLRLQTRLGILGLDYGLSYDEQELRNPLDGIIHFGLESKL